MGCADRVKPPARQFYLRLREKKFAIFLTNPFFLEADFDLEPFALE
jgi:hypothetical protein